MCQHLSSHLIKAYQLYLHPLMMRPEVLRDLNRCSFCELRVIIRNDETNCLQSWHIGEGITDEHAG